MAEENQIENIESDAAASEENPEENKNAQEDENQGDNDNENISESQPETKAGNSRKRGKWYLLLILLIFIMAAAGGAYKFAPDLFKRPRLDITSISSVNIEDDNLIEKELSPFFIPPSPGANSSMIRIDLSVIWDGLAAVRFQNKEIQVRDDIYKYISKLTEKTEDLNTEVSFIEAEMSNIFREALGVKNLVIMIKEINYFH
jgi:hypothetical protein